MPADHNVCGGFGLSQGFKFLIIFNTDNESAEICFSTFHTTHIIQDVFLSQHRNYIRLSLILGEMQNIVFFALISKVARSLVCICRLSNFSLTATRTSQRMRSLR